MASYLEQFNHSIIRPGTNLSSDAIGEPFQARKCWIFLHGLMGFGLNWRTIANGLPHGDQALIFDQRGHGKSIKPETGYAPMDFAEDLFLISEELGWNKFILVGHSMGGRNALSFAHRWPEKIEKLIIEDIGPEGDPGAPAYYKQLLDLVPTPFATKKLAKDFFMNEFPKKVSHMKQPQTLGAYLYANIIENPDGTADWRFSREAILLTVIQGRAKDQWQELRQLPMPTLIIRGENSQELSHEVYEKLLLSNPRVTGHVIANAGHWVHADQPQEFLRAILGFVG